MACNCHRRRGGKTGSIGRPLESGVAQGIGWAIVAAVVFIAFNKKVVL